jgi:Bacterial PH domain
MTRFDAAPLDTAARWLTTGIWVLAVAVPVGGVVALADGGHVTRGVVLVVVGAMLLGFSVYYRRRQPMAYEISEAGVTILPRAGSPRRFDGPTSIVPDARLAFRTFGSGGLYGYIGSFRLGGGASGPVKAFVTDRSRVVVVQVTEVRVAISPLDAEAARQSIAAWA